MSDTVAGLDLDRLEDALEIATGPSEDDDAAYITWHDAVLELLDAVPSLLAAARAVQRVEALIAPVARTTAHEALETSSPAYFLAMSQFADQVWAALGTEQEGQQ